MSALLPLVRLYVFITALTGVTVALSALVASANSALLAVLFIMVWWPVLIGCIFVYAVFEMDGRLR